MVLTLVLVLAAVVVVYQVVLACESAFSGDRKGVWRLRVLLPPQTPQAHYLRAAVVFVASLISVLALPQIFWCVSPRLLPSRLDDFLLFAPQIFFPYHTLVVQSPQDTHPVFSGPFAILLAVVQWGCVAAVFTILANRLRLRDLFPVAIITGLVVCILTMASFLTFGLNVVVDGP